MYLILGAGRLARHLAHYFELEGIQVRQWSREMPQPRERLKDALDGVDRILFLVKDDQIKVLHDQYRDIWGGRLLVHCSGSLVIEEMSSAHPLCSFSTHLFTQEFYRRIPFIIEKGGPSFQDLLPGLKNPAFAIEPRFKPLYHSLCVVSGNFTQILWSSVAKKFGEQLGLGPETLNPYMESVFLSLQSSAGTALTGPLARRDLGTIQNNLNALEGSDLQRIYEAFLEHFGISVDSIRGKK